MQYSVEAYYCTITLFIARPSASPQEFGQNKYQVLANCFLLDIDSTLLCCTASLSSITIHHMFTIIPYIFIYSTYCTRVRYNKLFNHRLFNYLLFIQCFECTTKQCYSLSTPQYTVNKYTVYPNTVHDHQSHTLTCSEQS